LRPLPQPSLFLYANLQAQLKTGIIGVKVRIMPPDIKLPDDIEFIEAQETKIEGVPETKDAKAEEGKKEITEKPKRKRKKKDESQGSKVNE